MNWILTILLPSTMLYKILPSYLVLGMLWLYLSWTNWAFFLLKMCSLQIWYHNQSIITTCHIVLFLLLVSIPKVTQIFVFAVFSHFLVTLQSLKKICWIIRRISEWLNEWALKGSHFSFFFRIEFVYGSLVYPRESLHKNCSKSEAFVPPLWSNPWLRIYW